MAYADWPAGVPFRPERGNWNGVPGREALATDMQGGDVRQRWQPGDDLATLQWGRGLTAAQMASWEAFLSTIAGGAARFLMPVSLNGQAYELRVVQIKGGKGGLRCASLGAETLVSFSHYVFPTVLTPPVPVITATGDQVVGTGTSGQTIEIDFGGAATRSVVAAGGAFTVDTPFLNDGAYWVRARYAGGQWSIPVLMAMPTPLKSTLRAQLLGSASGVALDFAGTMGGLILAPASPASQYLGPATGVTTFARASIATYVDKDGILRTAAANAPRLDFDPVTRQSRGLRLEASGTNRCPNSLAAGAVYGSPGTMPTGWAILLAGGLSREIIAPQIKNGVSCIGIRIFGTPSATTICTIQPDNAEAQVAGSTWTNSIFLGADNYPVAWGNVLLRANNEAAGTPIVPTSNVERYSNTRTITGANARLTLRFSANDTVTPVDFTFWLALPQREEGSLMTSPIPTSGTAVTREAEDCFVTMTSLINPAEGTLLIDVTPATISSGVAWAQLYQTASGTSGDAIQIAIALGGDVRVRSFRGGIEQTLNLSVGTAVPGQRLRVAVSFRDGAIRACSNGGPVAGATGFLMPALAGGSRLSLAIGSESGWRQKDMYFPAALSDAQLQALTAA